MQKIKFPQSPTNKLGYWIQVPDVISLKYKTVIDLHGMGGLGPGSMTTLDTLMIGNANSPTPGEWSETPQDLQVKCNELGILLLAAQVGSDWTEADINWCIDQAISKHNADPANIVLTGFSMGGGGVRMFMTSQSSTMIKAAVVVAGTGRGSDWKRATMPVWFFHCENDGRVPVSNTWAAIASMKAVGLTPKSRIDKTGGHGYNDFYRQRELYEWMFGAVAQPIPEPPQNDLKAITGGDVTINTNTYKLDGSASTNYDQCGWSVKNGPGSFWNIAKSWCGPVIPLYYFIDGEYIFELWVKNKDGKTITALKKVTVNLSGSSPEQPVKKIFLETSVPANASKVIVYEDKSFEFK